MNRKNILWLSFGIVIGLLLSGGISLVYRQAAHPPSSAAKAQADTIHSIPESTSIASAEDQPPVSTGSLDSANTNNTDNPSLPKDEAAYPEWSSEAIYNGGDMVLYQNRIYRAKWWTQQETPGQADVWEDTMQTPNTTVENPGETTSAILEQENTNNITAGKHDSFRVVAYYPDWKGTQFDKLQYDVLTHIVYAFAIPNEDGSLKPLDHPELAKQLIREAHSNQVKVLLAVGGWSYNEVPLEATFMAATSTDAKREHFAEQIIAMCNAYGFDGIDMDWEHPRIDGTSSAQYTALMLLLSDRLHAENKLLTSAVISGATPDGNIYYDAAAHTDAVLGAVDWIHVMAYDGGDGERHSSYEFAVACGEYWKNTRHMPPNKIVLGVPFYARPSWASYSDILAANANAHLSDTTEYNGMEVHYNGITTIQKKTKYAAENLGGIMIWEITQDTADKGKSLLTAIKNTLR